MYARIIETPEPRTPLVLTAVPSGIVTVGTFATGQSGHGSFQVVADAELGSFASAPEVDHPRAAV